MKRSLYNLTDEPFAMFVNRVGTVLREERIKHNVVGGAAVQSYILDMLTRKYGETICDLLYNRKLRMQDFLRSTDDLDLALKLEGDDFDKIKKINEILPKFGFEAIAPCEDVIVEIKPERVGASRPTFRVYTDGKGKQEEIIAMNVNRGNGHDIRHIPDEYYDKLIDESQKVVVPYTSRYNLTIDVPRLEHLLVAKVAGSRAKDLMDIKNLTDLAKETGKEIDFREMAHILLPENEKNYYKFLDSNYPEEINHHH